MKSCSYCGRAWKEENECCAYCGAPVKVSMIAKYDPFFYEGYIVYQLQDYPRCALEYVFYKGITFIGKVSVDLREVEKWNPVIDPMPMIIERLGVRA